MEERIYTIHFGVLTIISELTLLEDGAAAS